ncbi:hypothetical protein [Amycolatopsis aidingensis]|uniref:hypothetical protein n=1 Tax=Amycolatopsis aidingensis TaxID=2842453 RepID=UPI001C0BC2FB|nr:hypothetical protein [Amycolatopsis aidingensis]
MASETSAGATGTPGVWELYTGQPTPEAGGVNWEAYSHEALYQMLWQDADVADVSTIAAEWSEHRAALVNHTEVLREQRAALLDSWQGSGAEEAARRLAALADRVEKIAELAHAGEQAAEQAADALARARAMMPSPPGAAEAPLSDAAANWADVIAAPQAGAPVNWAPTVPTADPGGAFGAVGSAGFSFYLGADAADMQKQQAVRAMQTYESSLTNSGQLIGTAQDTIPAAATAPSGAAAPSYSGAATDGPRSWQSLVGSGHGNGAPTVAGAAVGALSSGTRALARTGRAAGMSYANQLAPGMRMAAMELTGGPGAAAARAAAEAAGARPGAMGGMVPPGAGARGGSDEHEHENQMPTIDHELFPFEEPDSEAVIGLGLEEYR